jgi:hypothetical protein
VLPWLVSKEGLNQESLNLLVERVGRELARDKGPSVDLDAVALALGDHASSTLAVSALLEFLESQGIAVDSGPSAELAPLLRDVLALARSERSRGVEVRIATLAERLGVEPRLVRVALLYAEVLMRGTALKG